LPALFGLACWVAVYPRTFLVSLLIVSPTLLASVTEPFWYCARYALLPQILMFVFMAQGWRAWFPRVVPVLMCVLIAQLARTVTDRSFSSPERLVQAANKQNRRLYGHDVQWDEARTLTNRLLKKP